MKLIALTAALTVLIVFGSANRVEANFILSHSFSGSGQLDGVTADVGGVNWVSGSAFSNNGNIIASKNEAASLAFTVQSGFVYTLSAKINNTGNTSFDQSLYIGFTGAATRDLNGTFFNSNRLMWQLKNDGTAIAVAGLSNLSPTTTYADNDILSVILDTTGANWKYSFAINNGSPLNAGTFSSNPSLAYASLGTSNAPGVVDDFQLSAVPEPSSIALMSGLAAGISVLSRRRRQA